MHQTTESNKTLLVDGAASVTLTSGKAEVFSCPIKLNGKVVVREGKRLPFFVLERATFEVMLGANAARAEVAGNTVPASWAKPLEAIREVQKKPIVVLVLGERDVGKSSYCTFLTNNLIGDGCRIAVLDADIGQSDIGPSATVSYALTSKPVVELYDLSLENAFFVGATSPVKSIGRIVEGLAAMKSEIQRRNVDFIVVNTDGWVTGEIALQYKAALAKELEPDVVLGVQQGNELTDLITNLGQPVLTVETSQASNLRTTENRKALREMTYARYLKDAKLRIYPLNYVSVEMQTALPTAQTPKKDSLVGLYGSAKKFLGIGVLREVNLKRKALKIQTAVSRKPERIVVGSIFLDDSFREIQTDP